MKRLLLVALLVLLVAGLRWLSGGLAVATGYSAKQLCSGVHVAGLPAAFVIENDIHLAMEVLGPLLPLLEVAADGHTARSSLLGNNSVAIYHPGHGCVLNPAEAALDHTTAAPVSVESSPLSEQLNPELLPVLDRAFAEPREGVRKTLAVLVLHQGKVIAERYAPPVTVSTPMQGWSMNKSLTASWVGVQVERGELSLEQGIKSAVAAADTALAGPVSPALDLSNLLHMESGFDFEETYLPGDDATYMLYRSPAAWRVAPGVGQAAEPGERFNYSSGDTNLASRIWQDSLGGADYAAWLQDNFYHPIGVSSAVSEHDPSGTQVGSSFTYMTARDWARVGQFWLDAWHGRSDLLSQEWQQAASRPRASAANGEYGRGFWLNAQGVDFPNLPRNLFYASGHNAQYVVVFPDEEVVVVRLGLSSGHAASGIETLLEEVLAVVRPPAPAETPAPSPPPSPANPPSPAIPGDSTPDQIAAVLPSGR